MKPKKRRQLSEAQPTPTGGARRPGEVFVSSSVDTTVMGQAPVEISEERTLARSRKRRRSLGEHASPTASPAYSLTPEEGTVDEQQVKQTLLDTLGESNSANATINSSLSPLEAFLQQRLPYLDKNPLHTASKATRSTKFFDMHLAQLLRLRKIVFLEGLLDVILEICDKYVSKIVGSGRDTSSKFPEFKAPSSDDIMDEGSLVVYFQNVNALLSRVASGLLFETDWDAVFKFSPQATDTKSSAEAAADAHLFIRRNAAHLLSSQDNSDISLIRKYDLSNFVLWEFKNLGFGPHIFRALQALEGEFDWTTCQERVGRHDDSCSCTNQHHRAEGRLTVTGRPTGPDAVSTENIAKKSTIFEILADEERRPSKRSRKDVSVAAQKKARCIIQQAWASAVAQDATFMVISSGNEECIAIRHRESQTLFVSPPFRPSDAADPYIKIYMGLYIIAYQDAVDRARELESGSLSPFTKSLLRLQIDAKPDLPNATSSGLFDRHPVEVQIPLLGSADFIRILNQTPYLDLRLHRRKLATTQYNEKTWSLTRFPNPNVRDNSTLPIDLPLASIGNGFAFLDLERLFSETSRVWRVYLGVARDGEAKPHYFSEPLVLKMSRDYNEGARLRDEFEKYQILQRAGVTGIVTCYGLFSCQVNLQDKRFFLLLKDGGCSIAKRPSSTLSSHSIRHQESYRSALESFHEKKFTHNNITREHVLFDVSRGQAALISLSDCGTLPAIEAMATSLQAKDTTALALCLGIAYDGKAAGEGAAEGLESANGDEGGDGSKKTRHRPAQSNPFSLEA